MQPGSRMVDPQIACRPLYLYTNPSPCVAPGAVFFQNLGEFLYLGSSLLPTTILFVRHQPAVWKVGGRNQRRARPGTQSPQDGTQRRWGRELTACRTLEWQEHLS